MVRERVRSGANGFLMFVVFLAGFVGSLISFVRSVPAHQDGVAFGWLLVAVVCAIGLRGLFIVNPNEGKVLQLFGDYAGTVKTPGLRWANPFFTKRSISQRVRNFESGRLKVNDADGNPIEIAAVVVWRVVDTAEAVFEVDDYEDYLKVQTEAAVRGLASRYAYDAHDDAHISLRGSSAEVTANLKTEIQERLGRAGVHVMEARLSHLAYAPEIAAVMLRRQQAAAVIAARQKIVEGAVGMVDMALELLEKSSHVRLDDERKAAMVSNLLVVLCADREAQPVVNTGTIYQ